MTSNVDGATPVTQAELNAHSEQGLTELVYVQTANQLLGSAMVNLEAALAGTQNVLNTLQAVQNLHNQISVKNASAFQWNYGYGLSSFGASGAALNTSVYVSAYYKRASAYFGGGINPYFVFTSPSDPNYASFSNALESLKATLKTNIAALSAQSSASALSNPDSLVNTVRTVYNDLPSTFGTAGFSSVEDWVLDNYSQENTTSSSSAGKIQNDLTFAITAAENLNDTQKEKVQNFLYIFQEYYQSASAVLSTLNTVAQQIAKNISS